MAEAGVERLSATGNNPQYTIGEAGISAEPLVASVQNPKGVFQRIIMKRRLSLSHSDKEQAPARQRHAPQARDCSPSEYSIATTAADLNDAVNQGGKAHVENHIPPQHGRNIRKGR